MATEEPPFVARLQESAFEVRTYPALIAAQVQVNGSRSAAVNAGFRMLAGYIFGDNTSKKSIAMTAPVMQTSAADGWKIEFVMPKSYTEQSLPKPNDRQVQLLARPSRQFAVVRFSGLAAEDTIADQTAKLVGYMEKNRLRATGVAILARYDPPWTLWFMRRNEVMIPL